MKKLMPWLRLGAFCFALFGISALAMLLKQGRLLEEKQADGDGSAAAPAEGDEPVKAGLDPGKVAGGGSSRPATGTEDAKRAQSLATGRALFDLPAPISISEASDLLNELKRQKADNDARRAALEQREKELASMEREIETRRLEVLKLAEKLQLNAPIAAADESDEQLDPKTLTNLAGILASMQPDAAARWLEQTPSDKAALILLRMEQEKAAEILALIQGDRLVKLTEMLLRSKDDAGDAEDE